MVDLTEEFLRQFADLEQEVLTLRECRQDTERLKTLEAEFTQLKTDHAQLLSDLTKAREDGRLRADEQTARYERQLSELTNRQAGEKAELERQLAEARRQAAEQLQEIKHLNDSLPSNKSQQPGDERLAQRIKDLEVVNERLKKEVESLTSEKNWFEAKLQERGRSSS